MNRYNIIPSSLQFKSAPEVDQEIDIFLSSTNREIIEYDRSVTVDLAQVFDDERQASFTFRPTFKLTYLYGNTITGTTDYPPFFNNLYYVQPEESKATNIWKGYPQYYEFDFYRPDVRDNHFNYRSKSAFTYNWMYYITYPSENNYSAKMYYSSDSIGSIEWVAKDGIPFIITNAIYNGKRVIRFNCISSHGLSVGEYVQLSFKYASSNIFQVFNLGNGFVGSEEYVFNIINIGYTGNTFINNTKGTFKRVINPVNLSETLSKYYVRKHTVLTNLDDLIMTKNAFEKNVFNEEKKFEYAPITPNNKNRVSQKTSSNSYSVTSSKDLEIVDLLDNQKRPVSQLFLTIVNKGYSGYFNFTNNGSGIKQGWAFNLTKKVSSWWDNNNVVSNSSIKTTSYTRTNVVTKTFFYNENLVKGDTLDGDFCEWNDYEQRERVISQYFHKIKFNPNVFQTTSLTDTNSLGYYYQPHHKMEIRSFSDYIETGSPNQVENIPSYSFYSRADRQFRWRDIYSYGFVDALGNGVDYPFLNGSHYPYTNVFFRLIPEGSNFEEINQGAGFADKPLIDDCE